jgi:hypothetical protein
MPWLKSCRKEHRFLKCMIFREGAKFVDLDGVRRWSEHGRECALLHNPRYVEENNLPPTWTFEIGRMYHLKQKL